MSIRMAGDIECFGVTDQFICGTWALRNKKGTIEFYTFTDKRKYEQWIIDFAKKQRTEVHVYFHNLGYDFFRFADLENKLSTEKEKEGYHIINLTNKPLVDYVNEEGKPLIKYFDTYRLIRKSLEEIGLILGYEKKRTSEGLTEKYHNDVKQQLTFEEMQEIIMYNQRDAEITLRAVEFIKEQLRNECYSPLNIASIGQLAIGLFNKRMISKGLKYTIYEWKETTDKGLFNTYYRTKEPELIRAAYKSGRIEAIQTGDFENCTNIDVNSLFPKAMMEIPFPNLKKEIIIINPEESFKKEEILNQMGVLECRIKCPKQKIGYLPIRIKIGKRNKNNEMDTHIEETIYPKHECELIGTWTNYELKKAEERGYEIKEMKKALLYGLIEEEESPLKQFIQECYNKRKKGHLENNFYKYIMNNLHGKFAERRKEGFYIIDDISEADKYLEEGYKIKTRFGFNYIYTKQNEYKYSPNFAPIISAYTTAYSREHIWKEMMKIPPEDLIYIGTDSILYKGDHLDKYEINDEIGGFKIIKNGEKELKGVTANIYGKNNYRVDTATRISGVNKKEIAEMTKEELEQPFEFWKFPSITDVNEIKEMYVRRYEIKDLMKIRQKTEELEKYIQTLPIIIDSMETVDLNTT